MKRSIAFLLASLADLSPTPRRHVDLRQPAARCHQAGLRSRGQRRVAQAAAPGTIRLEEGCTASFISRDGLILTNHHCAQSCIVENSTAERDLLAGGFKAASREQELRCQSEAASVLVDMQNVTDTVLAAVKDLPDADANTARRRN